MSNIYIQEPPTKGKVLLKTSVGDIDLELWSKEAPLACRNFVQLCLEGGTTMARSSTEWFGLCVQGGDPTGTGEGGQSVYGKPFKDEFHQRLRFVRRGLVAMANSGPNDNGSQFFFTLDRADHLHGKHTIFAKVTGKTVYNMLKLAEVEVDGEDRPLHPHKIKATEVLFNPFDDIVPREIIREEKKEKKEEAKSTARATKNFKLLSFGDEAEEDEEEVNAVTEELRPKGKSSHDLLKDDPRLSSVPAVPTSPSAAENQKRKKQDSDDSSDSDEDSDSPDEDKEAIKEKIRKKLKTTANVETPAVEEKVQAKDANVVTADSYDIYDPRNPMNKRRMEASKQAMKEKGRKFVKDQ
ncbi:Peptidyl-prolyl isomerase cwc27 [Branchiostoma belcheri]|nr:Peptidyl-prolyl isomerase cwc27 [Branchiostoma belcheri]